MGRERCGNSAIQFIWKAQCADAPMWPSVVARDTNLPIGGSFGFAGLLAAVELTAPRSNLLSHHLRTCSNSILRTELKRNFWRDDAINAQRTRTQQTSRLFSRGHQCFLSRHTPVQG